MAHFFNYDRGENKHRIYAFELINEKQEVVGYRPIVERNHKNGGIVETISENFFDLKYKIFSTDKLAREYAITYFNKLKYPNS
jgi:hypothetical protein